MSESLFPELLVPEMVSCFQDYINVADPLRNFCAILVLALLAVVDMDSGDRDTIPSEDSLWLKVEPFFQDPCPIIKVALCNLIAVWSQDMLMSDICARKQSILVPVRVSIAQFFYC